MAVIVEHEVKNILIVEYKVKNIKQGKRRSLLLSPRIEWFTRPINFDIFKFNLKKQ